MWMTKLGAATRLTSYAAMTFILIVPFTAGGSNIAMAESKGNSSWVNVDSGEISYYDSSTTPLAALSEITHLPVVALEGEERSTTNSGVTTGLAAYTLGILYDGASFTGSSQGYFSTNSSICTGVVYTFNTLGTWNDRAGSFQGFNGCQATLFLNTYLGGAQFGPFSSATGLGAFNNQVSSMKMS